MRNIAFLPMHLGRPVNRIVISKSMDWLRKKSLTYLTLSNSSSNRLNKLAKPRTNSHHPKLRRRSIRLTFSSGTRNRRDILQTQAAPWTLTERHEPVFEGFAIPFFDFQPSFWLERTGLVKDVCVQMHEEVAHPNDCLTELVIGQACFKA